MGCWLCKRQRVIGVWLLLLAILVDTPLLGLLQRNVGYHYLAVAWEESLPQPHFSLQFLGRATTCVAPASCRQARDWLLRVAAQQGTRGRLGYHLGIAQMLAGNEGQARTTWGATQGDDFGARLAYFWLGHALVRKGEKKKARHWWRVAKAGRWLLWQAGASVQEGDAERAVRLLDDALAVDPGLAQGAREDVGIIYGRVGDLLMRKHRPMEAVKFYQKALAYVPQRVEMYTKIGNALTNLRDYEAAIGAYDKAVVLHPRNGYIRLRLAEAYRRAGMFDRAEAEARRVLELEKNGWKVRAYEFLGQLYEQTRRPKQAEEAYWKAIALNNGPSHLYIRLAALLVRQKRFGEAEAVLREVIENGNAGLQAWAWQTLGWSYEVQQQWDAAEQAYREALALADNRDDYRLMLARVLHRLDRFPEAEAVYRQAAESANPGWRGQAWFELGTLYEQQQHWEAAEAAYRHALAAAPQRDDYRIHFAEFLQRRQRVREAETLLHQAAESRNPGWRAQAWFSLGNLYWSQQRWTAAIAAYEAAVEANPNNPGYWRRLAEVYEQQGMPEKAETARQKARSHQP